MKTTRVRRFAGVATMFFIAVGLILYFTQPSRAQYGENSFISLIRPYLNEEIEVGSAGQMQYVTLEEIGYDYVIFRDHRDIRTAVPHFAITSVTLGEKPIIHVAY